MSREQVISMFGQRVAYTNPKGQRRQGRVIGYDYRPCRQLDGHWVVVQPDDEEASDVGRLETVKVLDPNVFNRELTGE